MYNKTNIPHFVSKTSFSKDGVITYIKTMSWFVNYFAAKVRDISWVWSINMTSQEENFPSSNNRANTQTASCLSRVPYHGRFTMSGSTYFGVCHSLVIYLHLTMCKLQLHRMFLTYALFIHLHFTGWVTPFIQCSQSKGCLFDHEKG